MSIFNRKKQEEEELFIELPGDFEYTESWFSSHSEEMPECCQACGGPYPNCVDSCAVFDD